MKIQFAKLKIIYKTVQYIAEVRQKIITDLVAYSDDPVRYKRRMRFLIQLSEYEHQLLIKFNNLDDDLCHYSDDMIQQLKDEIDLVTDHSS
jgi:hypothetical protein